MFKYYGTMGRKPFIWASLLRIGLFVASVAGFPFILSGIVAISGCRGIGGACGALGVIVAMGFKPLAFAIFDFSFIGVAMRRARDAGLPSWVGLLIPLLFAA